MTIKTQTITDISNQNPDATITFSPYLVTGYARALYDLGMHDTLKILDPKYNWVKLFKNLSYGKLARTSFRSSGCATRTSVKRKFL